MRLFNREIFTAFDLRPVLGRIGAPTLVIAGEEDFITGPVCAEEIAAALTDATLVLLPDCGHFIFLEQRDRFAAAVTAFLAEGAPPG